MNSEVRRILVVEDERAIAEAVAARLRAEGFAVEVAGDGPTGVAAAQRIRPDLVVLDIMLPGFDGLEVCRRIQAERPVPVIMLTARDEETDLLVGLAMGADDYLTKPFSVRELAARVHALLRRMEKALAVNRADPAPPITVGAVTRAAKACVVTRTPGSNSMSSSMNRTCEHSLLSTTSMAARVKPPAPPRLACSTTLMPVPSEASSAAMSSEANRCPWLTMTTRGLAQR